MLWRLCCAFFAGQSHYFGNALAKVIQSNEILNMNRH